MPRILLALSMPPVGCNETEAGDDTTQSTSGSTTARADG